MRGIVVSSYEVQVLQPVRDEDLIIPESMTQGFGCTVVLEIQAHSRLRNCISGAAVLSKDQSDSGIIEFSSLSNANNVVRIEA